MFTKDFLFDVRRLALRKRVWFSSLDNVERGILSIAAKVINTVKSSVLNFQLAKIIAKLRDACNGGFIKHLERFGMDRLRVIQAQAVKFGYLAANELTKDLDFINYLMFLDYNQPTGWRIYS
jgi:hypothetical protein